MIRPLACVCLALSVLASSVAANPADTKAELKARFKARDAALANAEHAGLIGENVDGFVEAVDHAKPDESVLNTLKDENADRKILYALIAEEETNKAQKDHPGAKVTPATVGHHNAERNFRRAQPDDFLRVEKNYWIQKKDESRYLDLLKLKGEGKVGETADGTVEAVTPQLQTDSKITSLVDAENKARLAQYDRFAKDDKTEPSAVARKYAKIHFDNAHIGEMLKDADGWHKKQ